MNPTTLPPDALGIPAHLQHFEPTREAALQRIATISPSQYARTRNALDGAVTGLSPYLTHGIVSMPEVAALVAQNHRLSYDDKLVFEFGWREFFHHVWGRSAKPEAILQDMRPANLWRGGYAQELPQDIREGRTGVPCIDAAVRQLYATGYLHNHARMWLASYCVHLRKVHWRAGADWLYAHLLDGDLASNHLSWQWVASTFSSKPYLFNAANVAKFAPQSAWKAWASTKTAVDMSYEQLDTMAREQNDVGPEPGVHARIEEPARLTGERAAFLEHFEHLAGVSSALSAMQSVADKLHALPSQAQIECVTPWALSERSTAPDAPHLRIGVVILDVHNELPWSLRRWEFVLQRMAQVCDAIWVGNVSDMPQLTQLSDWLQAHRVKAQATLMGGYRQALPRLASMQPAPRLLAQPAAFCGSFSKFYERVQRDEPQFKALLALPTQSSLL